MRRLPLRSPPRMRGKVPVCCPEHRKVRITPAYAGKRTCTATRRCGNGDHPRVCGEKFTVRFTRMVLPGSPPRMRGKDPVAHSCKGCVGITPACAGKSVIRISDGCLRRDHPRVCGEKISIMMWIACLTGSPPRMRGKAFWQSGEHQLRGITPAYAGKSVIRISDGCLRRDHPRVCGEKHAVPVSAIWSAGSPPRVRGKASCILVSSSTVGITPAYAGKSARRQAGPPGPAPPPQMRLGWSPPPCTGRQCRTRKSTHARRARIPAPAHTPAPQ